MINFRNFELTENEKLLLKDFYIKDVFEYTESIMCKNISKYISLDELERILTKNHYFVIDNNYILKKNNKLPLGRLFMSDKYQLLEYIRRTIEDDLAENMRFVDINLQGGIFILDDNNNLIYFGKN